MTSTPHLFRQPTDWLLGNPLAAYVAPGATPVGDGLHPGRCGECSRHLRRQWPYDLERCQAWIARLNANDYLGVSTWRQPAKGQPDATFSSQIPAGGGHSAQGIGLRCAGSELGNLFNGKNRIWNGASRDY